MYKVSKLLDIALEGYHLNMVCNFKSKTPKYYSQKNEFDPASEFLSDNELDEIINMLYECGLKYDLFYDETEFMKKILDYDVLPSNLIVYNSAQSGFGAGRKSLIPAFCQLHQIKITGSNPYVVALCRNKYHVNRILKSLNIPVPDTYCFDNGWIMNLKPSSGTHVIIKPNYESSSIGIDENSIIENVNISTLEDILYARQKKLNQPLIVQEFIPGYEAELPCVVYQKECITMNPVGIKLCNGRMGMENSILSYNLIYHDRYEFYNYKLINPIEALQHTAKDAVRLLGMTGLCRVDYRIKENGEFFITDVSTNPHFIQHSSVHHAFCFAGFKSSDIIRTIIASCL